MPPRRDGGLGWLGLARSSEEGAGWSPCARGARGVWRWEGRNAGKVGVQKARGIGVAIVGQATVTEISGFFGADRSRQIRWTGPSRLSRRAEEVGRPSWAEATG